ncbi:hypothetical protein SDC9_11394 [bioreactor metagenome]|uniref:Uncharacterized protein n=1 Tax=bioreactor metagenome TaxID=1076179 RepID=A0A644TFV0_9ZZZZ
MRNKKDEENQGCYNKAISRILIGGTLADRRIKII